MWNLNCSPTGTMDARGDYDEEPATLDTTVLGLTGERLRSEQQLALGMVAGAAASLAGALVWAAITVATNLQIGWMAVALGAFVGFAVRLCGKGVDPIFALGAAALALGGCVAGNLLTAAALVANQEAIPFASVIDALDLALAQHLLVETFHPLDLLFYAAAAYEAHRLAPRRDVPVPAEAAGPATVRTLPAWRPAHLLLLAGFASGALAFTFLARHDAALGRPLPTPASELVGTWVGELPVEGQTRRWLITRDADGTFAIRFKVYEGERLVLDQEESGRWGAADGTYVTVTTGVGEGRAVYREEYDVLELSSAEFTYRHREKGTTTYTVRRVAPDHPF